MEKGNTITSEGRSQMPPLVPAIDESMAAYYHQILHLIPVALYTCDESGFIQLFNQASVDMWERTPEIGKEKWCGAWKIYYPDGINRMPLDECSMAVAVKEGRAVHNDEMIIENERGLRKVVRNFATPILNSVGKVTGAVNMLVDSTETKQYEKTTAHFAAIVESSDDAIISKTLDGIITSWNDAASQIFGYTAEEMIGEPITKIIPKERINEEPEILNKLKRGERVEHFETKRRAKNGELLDISLTISPVKDTTGRVVGVSKIARYIGKQKEAEQKIRESEERVRMAVECTKLGTWEFLPRTGELKWSEECRDIYGVTEDIPLSFDFFSSHLHPDDAEVAQAAINKAMDPTGLGNYDIKFRILKYKTKEPRWIRSQGKVYFNSNGDAERFIGTVLDIQDEKEEEELLKESIELFTEMADNVPAMIWMSGTDKFTDFFNKTWLNFTGRTSEQEANEGWLENVHPDDVAKCVDDYNLAYEEQRGSYTEYRLKRKDGVYRWIGDNSVPRYNNDGSFAGFISACMDIDDQKLFRQKIEESEMLFKTIANASPAALWLTDNVERNIFVSNTWLNWTGQTFEGQINRGWLAAVTNDDRAVTIEKFRKCYYERIKFAAEFKFARADGEIRWGLTEGYPYYDSSNVFAGYAGSVTDITDLKKLEERKDDFIKMASHELKTPITSIKGYIQLLLSIYEDADENKVQTAKPTITAALQTVSRQVSKLTRLISELLDLTKMESGQFNLQKTKFNLNEMVEEVVEDMRHTTSRTSIAVHHNVQLEIFADRDRLAQVLINLLTNAIKYSPDANQVEIFIEEHDHTLLLSVKDSGIGIDKKDQVRIFERFYRVEGESEETYPGFGIGLFIACEIMERHNGTIAVESEKSKGAVFTVSLPITP